MNFHFWRAISSNEYFTIKLGLLYIDVGEESVLLKNHKGLSYINKRLLKPYTPYDESG